MRASKTVLRCVMKKAARLRRSGSSPSSAMKNAWKGCKKRRRRRRS